MIFILILTTVLAISIVRQYQRARKLPPGPAALPLIGNIPQLVYHAWRNKGIVPAFEYFRKTYGNVFTIWMGPFPHVSIADFETNHEVFVKNGNHYKDRFLAPILEECNESHGLVFANGDIWAEMRRFTMLTFRNLGVGRDIYEDRVLEEIDGRCSELDAIAHNGNIVVDHGEFFELMVGSMINSLLVGKRFEEHNKSEFFRIRQLIDVINEHFTLFDMIVPVWLLKTFFPHRYKGIKEGMDAIADYVGKHAEQRIKDMKSGRYIVDEENPKDFVDAFLVKMEKENKNGGHPAYTMKSLKFVLSDLWSAGHDTTATTLTSAFNQFANHPEIVKKVRAELMKVTDNGSRPLRMQDRTETHYLNATIAEVQRHASVLNVNFWKVSDAPTKIDGYELDSGEILTAQIGALHANEDIFKDAKEFNPERFLQNDKLISQLIPFGIGKRSCVGENVARTNLYLIIGNFLLRYEIQPHEKLPSTEDQFPYTSAKIPDRSVKLQFIKL